jgi:hypothetical protein
LHAGLQRQGPPIAYNHAAKQSFRRSGKNDVPAKSPEPGPFCSTSQPAKIIGNLPEQINHLGFEMGHI